jgi:hypothetical protein
MRGEEGSTGGAAVTETVNPPDETAHPPGEWARIELPGYVHWDGWVAEETYAGAGVLVVRDTAGTVRARISATAFRQVIPLPTPGPVALAITGGGCTCGPLQSDPESPDERPDCPVHGLSENGCDYGYDEENPF